MTNNKMRNWIALGKALVPLSLYLLSMPLWALQERHLIFIRHGEAQDSIKNEYNSDPTHPKYKPAFLTEKGRQQVKETAERLLTHGFDNRSIAVVYVSPLPRALETAQLLADIGLYDAQKIKIESRLIDNKAGNREGLLRSQFTKDPMLVGNQEAKSYRGESNEDVRYRVLALYDEAQQQSEGHVLFISHEMPAYELIDSLLKTRVRLSCGAIYVMPLVARNTIT